MNFSSSCKWWLLPCALAFGCSGDSTGDDQVGTPDASLDRQGSGSGGGATGGEGGGGAAGSTGGAVGATGGASGNTSVDANTGGADVGEDGATPIDASTGPITIATGQKKPTGITLSATYVYWADETDGVILSCPKTGCGGLPPTVVVSGQTRPHGITLDGTILYWVTQEISNTAGAYRCALSADGGPGTCHAADIVNLGVKVAGPIGGAGIAVSDDRFYVAAGMPFIPSCPITGCGDAGQTTLDNVAGPKYGVAVGPAGIFYAKGAGEIGLCSPDGCKPSPTVLVTSPAAFAIAIDDQRLYWSNYNINAVGADSAIRTCPITGCTAASAQVLAAGQIGPFAIAVDETSIYYTDAKNGRVERSPKTDFTHTCSPNLLSFCESCSGYVQCNETCTSSCAPPDSGPDGI